MYCDTVMEFDIIEMERDLIYLIYLILDYVIRRTCRRKYRAACTETVGSSSAGEVRGVTVSRSLVLSVPSLMEKWRSHWSLCERVYIIVRRVLVHKCTSNFCIVHLCTGSTSTISVQY